MMVSIEPEIRPNQPNEAEAKIVLADAAAAFDSRVIARSSVDVGKYDEIDVDDQIDISRLRFIKSHVIGITGSRAGWGRMVVRSDAAGTDVLILEMMLDDDPSEDSRAEVIAAVGVSKRPSVSQ